MSSLNAILNTSSNAVMAYQAAISVTGQNIANADNKNYSIQSVNLATTFSVKSRGNIYGTGVTVDSVVNSVNQMIENSMTSELSNQSALEEAQLYMDGIENLFSEDGDNSLNTLLDAYWSAWEDLGNNPSGDTEQNAVYDAGTALTERINTIHESLSDLTVDLNREISSGVSDVNNISEEIASLNLAIMTSESAGGHANDLVDDRNALVDDLGKLIDIDVTVKEDGSYLIISNGLPLVEDGISYDLSIDQKDIYWTGQSGNRYDITNDLSGGAIAGWLEVRDGVIPETQAEFDELTTNLIWTLNHQHAQGAGQTYFSGALEGTYEAGESGTFDSLYYGDEIDYTKDFSMVIQDATGTTLEHQTATVDMAISTSEISNITGTGQTDSIYELTVIDEGSLGDKSVVQSSGALLGDVSYSASGISFAMDDALAEQTLTITNGSDTQTLEISDTGSGARRSAADIAEELSDIDGIEAYASSTSAHFDTSNITLAADGDIVTFTLDVDGVQEDFKFTVDTSVSLSEQFEGALKNAAQSINETNQNTDMVADDLSIESTAGATIGIYDFNVVNNAGMTLSNFQNFDTDDSSVSFELKTAGGTAQSLNITVDLTDVDTTDSVEVAQAFYDVISDTLADNETLTVELDDGTDELTILTTDGSNVSLSNASEGTGNDATIDLINVGSSVLTGNGQLRFDGADVEEAQATFSSGDRLEVTMDASGSEPRFLDDTDSGATDAVAMIGSVTIVMEPGMAISSDENSTTGLFGASLTPVTGTSIITLGGAGGYEGFDAGETIKLTVDGLPEISYTAGATDVEHADNLYNILTSGGLALPSPDYEVIQNGASVSIVKTGDTDAVVISGFTDAVGSDAVLSVSTGTGSGSEAPKNDKLVSGSTTLDSTTAVTFGDSATVYWEIFDNDGNGTGSSGYLEVDEAGTVEIDEGAGPTLEFEISEGTLVAGNTLRINTDDTGAADIFQGSVTGKAASVDDTYEFTVTSGGTLPDDKEDIVIQWTSETGSGTIELKDDKDEELQITAEVDGMTIAFDSGTLVNGDVFYVTTDENGEAVPDADGNTLQTLSDWHWTLDSFADEFNRSAGGVTASVTKDNAIALDTNDDYCAIDNVTCSGNDNIDEENFEITVLNYTAFEIEAEGLEFVRSNGTWDVQNDPTGGILSILPEGGDDDGFQVDLTGNGIGDIEIKFEKSVLGDGYIRMDLASRDADDLSYAFAGNEDGDSGLAAALGINTFFTGSDASDIGVNEMLSDGDLLASGFMDTETGELGSSDNTNANAMADTRYDSLDMKAYTYTRGEGVSVTVTSTTLDDYQASLVSSVGSTAARIDFALDSSESLVYQLTEQRNSISAVSLDEEMINLTAQQQSYLAAAKLLTTVQEMFDAILATR